MITEIWRYAVLMTERHGDEAVIRSTACAEEYFTKGERDGELIWLRVVQAIEALQKVQPGEARN